MIEDWTMCRCGHYKHDHWVDDTTCVFDDCPCIQFNLDETHDESINIKREAKRGE